MWYDEVKIEIKDTLCFIPVALSEFAAMFKWNELHRGFSPHGLNTLEFLDNEGSLPRKQYYQSEAMKPERKKAFDAWYAAEAAKNEVFNLQEEVRRYCKSDVLVLEGGLHKFVEEF